MCESASIYNKQIDNSDQFEFDGYEEESFFDNYYDSEHEDDELSDESWDRNYDFSDDSKFVGRIKIYSAKNMNFFSKPIGTKTSTSWKTISFETTSTTTPKSTVKRVESTTTTSAPSRTTRTRTTAFKASTKMTNTTLGTIVSQILVNSTFPTNINTTDSFIRLNKTTATKSIPTSSSKKQSTPQRTTRLSTTSTTATTTTTTTSTTTSTSKNKQKQRSTKAPIERSDPFISTDEHSLTKSEYDLCYRDPSDANVLGELTFNVFLRSKFKDVCEEPCYRVCHIQDCVRLVCRKVNG